MKKTILLPAIMMAAMTASAQIPNAGFENWSTTNGYAQPDGWTTLNAMTNAMSVYTAEMGTPGHPGSSYLQLTSKTVSGMGVMPGIAATGNVNMATMSISGGFPYATRSANLTGAWQYMAMSGSDQGFIAAYLTKWNTGAQKRDTVAYANKPLAGMVMSWANFTIPLTYVSNTLTPDSALIILSSSGMAPANGSYLYVDNLGFSGSVAPTSVANTPGLADNLVVYPNPAKDNLNISFNSSFSGNYTIDVVDLSGKRLSSQTTQIKQGDNKVLINLKAFAPGTYVLQISNGTQRCMQKLLIQ